MYHLNEASIFRSPGKLNYVFQLCLGNNVLQKKRLYGGEKQQKNLYHLQPIFIAHCWERCEHAFLKTGEISWQET